MVAQRVAALYLHVDREIGALVFEPPGFRPVTQVFERHPSFPGWCKRCWDGDPCEHWNVALLQDEGYGPAESGPLREAAARLGLRWPWTHDQVVQAFRKQALRLHPDTGGTDTAMVRLLQDRDRLLERCAGNDSHGL